ncbi:spermatogenesis-associated serine-rich protein 2-like isoform X2 [Mercenaria mercenaria]|nr:spermatogenesis-associated serine-rich protein 2-like isoform X2 [Mercenaria mercenaria]XP_053385553.1 spermatogenesis-associated serine-rich protein 2-like isoform X2 [Mercenaria mercenaria]XP_053385554.1 spermatogenesis-associated serine-rich protein 2-like isoform X2 [Mercenaria mercenaria]
MADVAQENIKEKVNSVREVVSGRSNNEIILVLQFYDYDVEKTIQAYLEDGAKEALQEWQFSGTKPVKKKRNKKKTSTTQAPPAGAQSASIAQTPDSETGSATTCVLNGDISHPPVINGVLDNELDISHSVTVISNGPTTYHVPATGATSPYPTQSATTTAAAEDSNHFDVTLPNSITSQSESNVTNSAIEVKVIPELKVTGDKGAKEKSPSPQPQRQHHSNHHHNRQRAHSGSHGHNDSRDRTASTSSTDGKTGKKHAHLGLERSAKDLHRQTVSLDRLRLIFNEEVDKSCKRIKSVFDEVRTCLNAREAFLVGEVKALKEAGGDVFNMRQGLAHDLKVKIDRAERMSEHDLAELRLDIKHFVSDRKIDEDLAKTTRFMYDDKLKKDIEEFGEIMPVKCQYIQCQGSVSSVTSSIAMSESEQHIPKPTLDISSSNNNEKKPISPHLDRDEAHEVAELQRRLKHSLTLEGIPVKNYPERPESAPVSNNSTAKVESSPTQGGARKNNRNRQRNDRDRPPRQDGPKDDNRVSFNQAPNGERVILIGRKTGPQGSGRPPRGGRGRGGRGRGGSSSMNRGANTDSLRPGSNSGENSGLGAPGSSSASGSKDSSARKPQPQRENSGSPRRGRGRGPPGRRSNPPSSSTTNIQPHNSNENKREG